MKRVYLVLALALSLVVGWVNVALYADAPSYPSRTQKILSQLSFLKVELKQKELGTRMQRLFPEGYVFIHALYGLAWCELALAVPQEKALRQNAVKEATYALQALASDKGKGFFPESLKPSYGIFYVGWKNYLLGKLLQISGPLPNDHPVKKEFKAQCRAIGQAMAQTSSPYLESYHNQAWPADMFPAVASLAIHDNLYAPIYKEQISGWLTKVNKHLDPVYKMLPHAVDAKTGKALEGPRGNSMALMLRLLSEIDPALAQAQYTLFKEHFVSTALGLPSVRQYPKGTSGFGDLDSGPVVLGVGFPATLVAIGTFGILGDTGRSQKQYQVVHAFGVPVHKEGTNKYLLGYLPMADAFIAWSRATNLNLGAEESDHTISFAWFHLGSLLLLVFLWLPFFWKPLKLHISQKANPSSSTYKRTVS